ncbi:MAG: GntR family transcriptional regulator [Flavobacterium sp.]|jgi:GntR family transcriptional regulator
MEITIDIEAEMPLFEQLVDQIKKTVAQGKLQPGASLPSIRQLAGDLQINNKTVAKAYRLLERDTVIVTKGYRGTFVHENAVANSAIDFKSNIVEKLKQTINQLKATGATDSEIRIVFSSLMKGEDKGGRHAK